MNEKITYSDGVIQIHYPNVYQKDNALCGQDLAGDEELGVSYKQSQPTKQAVDCQNCLAIVKYCKSL